MSYSVKSFIKSWSGLRGQIPSFWRESAPLGLAYISFKGGGGEAEPVLGRLGFVEPIAKPTVMVGFFFLEVEGGK